jgi:hypothetical protein
VLPRAASTQMIESDSFKAIFFDAVGTLFYLTKTVGDHYALVGEEVGLNLDAKKLDAAFYSAWAQMPPREAIDGPRENDDKDWWRELADLVLREAAPEVGELDRDNFFEVAYEHFAEAGVWELYPEVVDILTQLRARVDLGAARHFQILRPRLRLERNRRRQTRPENFPSRPEFDSSSAESSLARRRRSQTRLESGDRRGIVDLSVGSPEKFAPRFTANRLATNGHERTRMGLVERVVPNALLRSTGLRRHF